MTTPNAARIASAGEAILSLIDALNKASEIQHDRPMGPSTRDDTPERGQGAVSRPTEDIATDERRLKLRAAVIDAELALEDVPGRLAGPLGRLQGAIEGWAGERY